MVLDLTNQQFILLFVCGTALIFIVTSLTHTHDIDAEEIALKTADKVEKSLEKITWTEQEHTQGEQYIQELPSGHKAPEGF